MSKQKTDRKSPAKKTNKSRHKPLFKGEKSLKHAKNENKIRIKMLRIIGTIKATKLADKLENCHQENRCKTPACAVCNRASYRPHVKKMRRILKRYGKGLFVTIVPTRGLFNPRALRQINTKRLINTLRKQMQRAGLDEALVVGGIEAVYKFDRKKVCLHWHLIFENCSKQKIDKLRHYYKNDRQIRVVPIKPGDEERVYWYCLKNVTFGKDLVTRKPKRPPHDVHAKLLYFLDRHTFRELMFLRGVRFNGKKLNVIDKSALHHKPKRKKGPDKKVV